MEYQTKENAFELRIIGGKSETKESTPRQLAGKKTTPAREIK